MLPHFWRKLFSSEICGSPTTAKEIWAPTPTPSPPWGACRGGGEFLPRTDCSVWPPRQFSFPALHFQTLKRISASMVSLIPTFTANNFLFHNPETVRDWNTVCWDEKKNSFINSWFYLLIKLAEMVPLAFSVHEGKKKQTRKKAFYFFWGGGVGVREDIYLHIWHGEHFAPRN